MVKRYIDDIELRSVKGYPDYWVDATGNVYSSKRVTFRKLKPINRRGWLFVQLHNGDTGSTIFTGVHRLVAEAFIPNDDPTLEVNHKNRIRDDTRVENLEWMSHTDNVRYSRCRRLKVTHDDGQVQIYEGMEDFCRQYPNWNSSNIRKYIKLLNGYSKKNKVRFEYID